MTACSIRRLIAGDTESAGALLVRTFIDAPLFVAALPDRARRMALSPGLFTATSATPAGIGEDYRSRRILLPSASSMLPSSDADHGLSDRSAQLPSSKVITDFRSARDTVRGEIERGHRRTVAITYPQRDARLRPAHRHRMCDGRSGVVSTTATYARAAGARRGTIYSRNLGARGRFSSY
jgi:hypothetical protein